MTANESPLSQLLNVTSKMETSEVEVIATAASLYEAVQLETEELLLLQLRDDMRDASDVKECQTIVEQALRIARYRIELDAKRQLQTRAEGANESA